MIWKTKTHQYSATLCQRTGKPCPALARLARAMVDAVDAGSRCATSEFEIEGSSELQHCAEGCTARFRACSDQIRLYCGVDAEAQTQSLDLYGDMIFNPGFSTLSSGSVPDHPCAMLEVRAIAPKLARFAPAHAAS